MQDKKNQDMNAEHMQTNNQKPQKLFDKKALAVLIGPLIIEQFLAVTVGMADTVMVSSVGEAAVSGISLVDTLNILLINVFSALATGGAVVSSYYLGKKDEKKACMSCNQLVLAVTGLSIFLAVISLLFNKAILSGIYGHIDADVMANARTYFYLTALSYPFLGLYNGAAAICRSMGNSKISMQTSACMNFINIGGNALLIYGLGWGAAGAGTATLVSRIVAALIMLKIITDQKKVLHIDRDIRKGIQWKLTKEILEIGVPTGLESGIFQAGKLMVAGLIASFGTASIAANAVGNTIASFEVIPGSAISLAMVTVVGQSIGAQRYKEAKGYVFRLMAIAHSAIAVLNLFIMVFCRQIVSFYSLSPEAAEMAWQVAMLHSICCIVFWPPSFTMPNALRAANDARFTMVISIASMFLFRIVLSYVLGRYLGLGLLGVWAAMVCDWIVRSIFFFARILTGQWLKHCR